MTVGSPRPSWWSRGAIALVSVIVALAVAEAAVRAFDPLGVSYFQLSTDYQLDKLADPDLVFRHAPSWQTRYGDVQVRYNERGLRDRAIADKAEHELRVLALGDSVTFGWGVPQEETFAAQLDTILGDRLDRPVRVINGGVGGYNTVQEVAYFRRDGLPLQPDLVILTYVENDVDVTPESFDPHRAVALDGKPPLETAEVLLGKSWLYRLAYYGYRSMVPRGGSATPEDDGWRASMSALSELVNLCEARRIPLVIFFFRWGRRSGQPLYEDVVRHAANHPVRDVRPWFANRDPRALMISRIDPHPNAAAHRIMAERMAEEIAAALDRPLARER